MPTVEDIIIKLPQRSEVPAFTGALRRKPRAEIILDCGSDGSRSFWVPVRVARLFAKDEPDLPCQFHLLQEQIISLENSCCYSACIEALARRDHSSDELKRKLTLAGYREQSVCDSLDRARAAHYLDDDRFASYFIQERLNRGWGRKKIELELSRRGVDARALPGYPDAYFSEEDDLHRALALLERKSIPETRPYDKLVRHLMSKGYSYRIAADAVRTRLNS